MKNIFILLAIISFVNANAQFYKGRIYLRNSTVVSGLIKERSFGGIKFKSTNNGDIKTYAEFEYVGYDINENGALKRYRNKIVKGYRTLMKVERLGKINLYSVFVSNSATAPTMGLPVASSNIFYVEKDGIIIRLGRKFKSSNLDLINDCPSLIEKIKNKEIKKGEIEKIIDFYNKCA